MFYKPSMFNRILTQDGLLVLYNSFGGTKSICCVSPDKSRMVSKWLTDGIEEDFGNETFSGLVRLGYLVPYNTDEKTLRKLKYMDYITDNRLRLVVHTTSACNFRCSYCYMNFKDEKMSEGVQRGIVNYIRNNIQRFSGVQISWFGGEPTLGMDVIENISSPVIDICRKQKKPYSAIITTNGYNLSSANINRLLQCHVNHIAVTIDGTRELHNKQRFLANGSFTFDHIIENLLYIRDIVKTQTLTVSIRTNILKDHLSHLDEYYTFFNLNYSRYNS